MARRLTFLAAAAAVAALGWPAHAAGAVDARLQGEFAMKGKITRADNVKGEHSGQTVKRKWRFKSTCAPGPFCKSVFLRRERAHHRVDKLTLTRTGPGTWAGHGRFYFSLRCAGRVYKHGGEAKFKITVVVTKATTIQTEPFATNITARYSNAHRPMVTPRRSDGSLLALGAREISQRTQTGQKKIRAAAHGHKLRQGRHAAPQAPLFGIK